MVYGAVGYAHLESDDANIDEGGYFIGGGVDYRLTESIILGAEVNYHVFESDSIVGPVDTEITTFGLNLAFTF